MSVSMESYRDGWDTAIRSGQEIVETALSDMSGNGAGAERASSAPQIEALAGVSLMTLVGAALGSILFMAGNAILGGVLSAILAAIFAAGCVSMAVGFGLMRIHSDSGQTTISAGDPIQLSVHGPAMPLLAGPNADQMALLQSSPHADFNILGRAITKAWSAASEDGRRRLVAVYLDPASRMAEMHDDPSTALPADEAATIVEATRRVEAMALTSRTRTTSIIAKVMRDRMKEV